jgi:hypothetical protein
LRYWDFTTGEVLVTIEGIHQAVGQVVLSRDDKYVVVQDALNAKHKMVYALVEEDEQQALVEFPDPELLGMARESERVIDLGGGNVGCVLDVNMFRDGSVAFAYKKTDSALVKGERVFYAWKVGVDGAST